MLRGFVSSVAILIIKGKKIIRDESLFIHLSFNTLKKKKNIRIKA